MSGYLRVLSYLRPHGGLFLVAIAAMTLFAALDVFSYTLLIPFLEVLFGGEATTLQRAGGMFGGDNAVSRLLEWSVGWLIAGRTPMAALRNVVVLLFVVFLVKNAALYVYQFSVSVVEGRVTRDIRNDIYSHLLRLGLPFFQRTRAGQVISRVTHDVDQVRGLVTGTSRGCSRRCSRRWRRSPRCSCSPGSSRWWPPSSSRRCWPSGRGCGRGCGAGCCGCWTPWARWRRTCRRR
jgi:ATP-binding cassette, subfamily B, bacterial MsbA